MAVAAGWYRDKDNAELARWHDGQAFTEHTVRMSDYPNSPPPPPQSRASHTAFPEAPPAPLPPPRQPQTRGEAKADAAAASARAKAMRPWFKKKRFILPLGLVVLLIIIAAASSGGDKKDAVTAGSDSTVAGETTTAAPSGKEADVTLVACPDPSYGIVKAAVEVTNHSSKSSNYVISITVEDASGTKVGDGIASVDHLNPGQNAKVDGFATVSDAASGTVTCSVSDVQRYAAP